MSLIAEVRRLFRFLTLLRTGFLPLAVSVFFSIAHGLVNLHLLLLLFPLVNGIITHDFSAARSQFAVAWLGRVAPGLFRSPTAVFMALVGWLYIATIFRSLFDYASALCISRQSRAAALRIREVIFNRSLTFGKLFFDQNGTARLNNILIGSTEWVNRQLDALRGLFLNGLTIAIFMGVIASVSWRLLVMLALVLPVLGLLMRRTITLLKRLAFEHTLSKIELTARSADVLAGIALVQGYDRQAAEGALFRSVSVTEVDLAYQMARAAKLFEPARDVALTTALLAVAWAIGYFLQLDQLAANETFIVLFLVMRIVPLASWLAGFMREMAESSGVTADFAWFMDDADKHIVPSGTRAFTGLKRAIEVKSLTFAYRADVPVLRDVSFSLAAGQTVALVGPSGSGKSTLANLLLRFYDCPAGTIFIDGVDLRDLDISTFRARTAFVGQETFLFNASIRQNICYGAVEPDAARLAAVVRRARLAELVDRLPEGLETVVGDRGAKLSGGEKQRIAIARALLKDPEILFLDEPTSSLDGRTETDIIDALEEVAQGRTVFVIAHRLSTIRRADHVLVLVGGNIAEAGPPARLREADGYFAAAWREHQGLTDEGGPRRGRLNRGRSQPAPPAVAVPP